MVQPTPAQAGWTQQTSGFTGNHEAVSCFLDTHCWAVGIGGRIHAMADNGPWMAQSSGTSAYLLDVSCPSATHCWAVGLTDETGGGAIVATTDGGDTWTTQTSGTVQALWSVDCVTATTTKCWAVGDAGTIRVTTNGGATWTAQTFPDSTTDALLAVDCISHSYCYAVGTGGGIIATSNGGTTWTRQSSGTTNTLYGVSCYGGTHCMAVGDVGTIRSTTNGGASWIANSSGTANTLNAVSCDAGPCWAVGALGTVRATFDWGLTAWTAQTSGVTSALDGVRCVGGFAYRCWAVGEGNIIAMKPPSAPVVTSKPSDPSGSSSATFSFTGEAGATFYCRLDGAVPATVCTSPHTYSGLADGTHTFQVSQRDESDQGSPYASYTWTVDTCDAPANQLCDPPDVPTHPMAVITIEATPGPSAPSVTQTASLPSGWACDALVWDVAAGDGSVTCRPPAAAAGFVNTCGVVAVNVETTGVRGNLYGESTCTSAPGESAAASTAANGAANANGGATTVDKPFTELVCRATAKPAEQLVRPWTVRCTVNH